MPDGLIGKGKTSMKTFILLPLNVAEANTYRPRTLDKVDRTTLPCEHTNSEKMARKVVYKTNNNFGTTSFFLSGSSVVVDDAFVSCGWLDLDSSQKFRQSAHQY